MNQLRTDSIKLKGLAPFEQIMAFYDDPADFNADLNSYLIGGVVISTPTMFAMGKPINSTINPSGQWYAEKPDAWYVRWFAGEGALQAIMDSVQPLEKVMFKRVKERGESDLRTYKWNRLYSLLNRRK